jgi:hypothetical protein
MTLICSTTNSILRQMIPVKAGTLRSHIIFYVVKDMKFGAYQTPDITYFLMIFALRVFGNHSDLTLNTFYLSYGFACGLHLTFHASTVSSQLICRPDLIVVYQHPNKPKRREMSGHTHFTCIAYAHPHKTFSLFSATANPTLGREMSTARNRLNPTIESACPKNAFLMKGDVRSHEQIL